MNTTPSPTPRGNKTALVASLCVRVCVSFLFCSLRWSFDQLVDDGVVGGLSDSVKEKKLREKKHGILKSR